GTAEQVSGNVNCPLSVAAAGVYYVFRCLMPPQTPACAGVFRNISLHAPAGCLVNARFPAAVAAGNVETSTRVVDVIMGALAQAIPDRMAAASHGSMNNLAMGSAAPGDSWDYYETMGGGMGASRETAGLSAVQTHMTNTLNTPVEVLEQQYPLRIRRYQVRRGSGGAGKHSGGDGLVRELGFLADAEISLLTERRLLAPWGLAGGRNGLCGRNLLNGEALPPKCHRRVKAGDVLTIETPGGGGWGHTDREKD
ncbi:hydantoinase B/oxoprolinase family protein, partial [Thiolapillus sp.]